MKKGLWIKAGILLLVIALVVPIVGIGCKEAVPTPTPKPTPTPTPTPTPKPEVFHWRCQSAFPMGGATGIIKETYFPELAKKTGGRLVIDIYPVGELCKGTELTNFVASGAVEMAFHTGGYTKALVPVGDVEVGWPTRWKDWQEGREHIYAFKDGELLKILREAYGEKTNSLVWPWPSSAYSLMTTFKMSKWSDLKGKKIRTAGLCADFMKSYGAAIVALPGAEQYVALQRGTCDATAWPTYTLEAYKLKEVVKYLIQPPLIPSIWVNFMVNKDAWNKLPDDLKETLDEYIRMELLPTEGKRSTTFDAVVLKKALEIGVETITLPESEMLKFQEFRIAWWDGLAAKDDYCARAIANCREFYKYKGYLK